MPRDVDSFINNAVVKNSNTGTKSSFYGENTENSDLFGINGSTFEGDMSFKIMSNYPQYEGKDAGNHYKGSVSFAFGYPCSSTAGARNVYICKYHTSIFEKNLDIGLINIAPNPLLLGEGGIIFGGAANTEISALANSICPPSLGDIAGVELIIKDATIRKTGSGKVILSEDSGPLTISNSLTFDGGIMTIADEDNNSIEFLDNATHSGASDISHVASRVYKTGDDAFTFPIGSGSKYTPVSISAPSKSTDLYSAAYVNSSPTEKGFNTQSKALTLTDVYDGGFWDISKSTGSSPVSITLGYNVPSGVIANQNHLRVAHWNGSLWENLGKGSVSGSLTVGTVSTASEVSTFSPFTLGFFDSLPVTLTSFSALNENQMANLKWTTTDEKNSSLFEIEHSTDAKQWKKIGDRKATGESKSIVHYDYLHANPVNGLNYYRLKMIDSDGSFAFSRIENLKLSTAIKTKVYPNPVANRLFIEAENGEAVLKTEIRGVNGVSLLTVGKNDPKKGIDLSGLSNGIYFLEMVKNTGQKETHKILVNK